LNPQSILSDLVGAQPLLRGAASMRRAAGSDIEQEPHHLRRAVCERVLGRSRRPSKAYFDLVSALEGLAIRKRPSSRRSGAVESNQRMAHRTASPIDVVAAQAHSRGRSRRPISVPSGP